jgi:Spy/CpxP family protein refolding chaperone
MICDPSKSEGHRRKGTQVNRKVFNSKVIGLGVGAAAFALALASGVALAGNQGGRGHFGRGIRAAMATLDLSDVQKEKVKAIFTSHKDQFQAFRTEAKANREALKAAASAANPDPGVVGAAFLKVRADRDAVRARMKAVRGEIDAILTTQQKAKLDGWIAAHRQHRRAAMRFGGPPPAN